MKLYDAPASNPMVLRLFVLERGGISLDVETIDVMNMENRGLEYRKINPRGEVPALVLDNGFVLTEVTAICEYMRSPKAANHSLAKHPWNVPKRACGLDGWI
uniref:GST N-terminal domain-containing protein n=1 Tax=Fusarium oxysporum (strain Fo5176) TaxID=660025 RepID=A0A0D2XG81_FUSOF